MALTSDNSPHPPIDLDQELALGLHLADLADKVSMLHFRSKDLQIDTKPDMTEVTIADRDTESVVLEHLAAVRPGIGVYGEEHGVTETQSGARWIIDPIDGTGNYVRGVPMWATLLALEVDGEFQVAVVSAPAMGCRWWAARGRGAFADGRRIRVSAISRLEDAFISYSEGPWERHGMRAGLESLRKTVHRERAFGDFWQHMLVAEGAVDAAVEAIVSLWDLAPLQLIVEEAGGRFTDLDGIARADGGSAVSTNGVLHGSVLAHLKG
jgi:histidinol-phosphatase